MCVVNDSANGAIGYLTKLNKCTLHQSSICCVLKECTLHLIKWFRTGLFFVGPI